MLQTPKTKFAHIPCFFSATDCTNLAISHRIQPGTAKNTHKIINNSKVAHGSKGALELAVCLVDVLWSKFKSRIQVAATIPV